MIELKGKYNTAKVFTDNIESSAISQIIELCNQEFCEDSNIRIMPDVHSGTGCTIGTTMLIRDKVVPNLVGVDIGCGMEVVRILKEDIDFGKLEKFIRNNIPTGSNVRSEEHRFVKRFGLDDLRCKNHINTSRAMLSLGTLGGGNHFIEVGMGAIGDIYLVIHSGSRYLGKQVAEYYQDIAYKRLRDVGDKKRALAERLKKEGRDKDIQEEMKKITKPKVSKSLSYLEGKDFDNYIFDMRLVQAYAEVNRQAIASDIVRYMGWTVIGNFTTIHNYIDTENMILRKGAISAQKDEIMIIPMNMSDGSIICSGKGNSDWNYSAPHGAGRLFSRSEAKARLEMENFEDSMEGIWTTSVCEGTLDESKGAYKPMEAIVDNIGDTVDIIEVVRPLYNLKDKPEKKDYEK
jgi:tRNA-splicing ligase RtcB (3'-phosphate/5'-hydroxy nucleic acid ligase)